MYRNNQSELGAFPNNFRQFQAWKAPIFPVFCLNIGKNTSNSFLRNGFGEKTFFCWFCFSYDILIAKSALASFFHFARVTLIPLPHVNRAKSYFTLNFGSFQEYLKTIWFVPCPCLAGILITYPYSDNFLKINGLHYVIIFCLYFIFKFCLLII